MIKSIRSAVTTGASVVIAGLSLAYGWKGLSVGVLLVAAVASVGFWGWFGAGRSLPARPQRWCYLAGLTEWLWISLLIIPGASAIYFGVIWGDTLDLEVAGKAALGAIAGVAFVKVMDVIAGDSDWIDTRVEGTAKAMFQLAYRDQFSPTGPIPQYNEDGQYTDEFLAVHFDEMYGGWSGDARRKRAEVMTKSQSLDWD